ncbi:MAG: glycosyltransferase family 4 protein [Pseudomonadaceae bacterium]|nr:glycosyltransferase family 4 protein [Pseudomonadaceae bacterium]
MALYIEERGGTPLVASSGGRWTEVLERHGVRHIPLPLHRKAPWWLLWNMVVVWWLIWRYRIHIVHARSRAPAWSGWLACKMSFFTRVEFITTFHGTYGSGNVWKRGYNRVMLRGKRVIANSAFIKHHLVETYHENPARIDVAPRGVDMTVFDPAAHPPAEVRALHDALAGDAATPLLLMVGRLTRWKGHAVLLQALARVADMPWAVALAGDCKNAAYLDELKVLADDLGIRERVRFLGPRQDIAALNAAADVALSCSTKPEAFGRVAIEAMAMETPVIASAHGGSLETVADGVTGWLVTPDDVETLAEALRKAFRERRQWAAMGKAGRMRVLAQFTSRHTCEAEWEAYQRLWDMAAA